MKIASITVTYNEYHNLDNWRRYYLEYKNDIYLHIIVDNGSHTDFVERLKEYFHDSIIIERKNNGGVTAAYNDGIRYAFNDPAVDAVLLICPDIQLSEKAIPKMYELLYSDSAFGMAAPVLLQKDSAIVENYGCAINYMLVFKHLDMDKKIEEITEPYRIVDGVPGGINIAKREFYERLGLQDERLFMYYDEVDIGIRAKNAGIKTVATKTALAWHQHINPGNKTQRGCYHYYLVGRNNVYLAGKHFGILRKILLFFYNIFLFMAGSLKHIIKYISNKQYRLNKISFLKGSYNGFIGNMK